MAAARSNAKIRQRALSYMASHNVMTLATHEHEGVWAAAVFYVNQDFYIYFLSAKSTRHAQNLAANPWGAATIQEDYHDWREIKGIQLEGSVEEVTGQTRKRAVELFGDKFSFLKTANEPMAAALKVVSWYLLKPERVYFIDNSRGFGHRDRIDLEQ